MMPKLGEWRKSSRQVWGSIGKLSSIINHKWYFCNFIFKSAIQWRVQDFPERGANPRWGLFEKNYAENCSEKEKVTKGRVCYSHHPHILALEFTLSMCKNWSETHNNNKKL